MRIKKVRRFLAVNINADKFASRGYATAFHQTRNGDIAGSEDLEPAREFTEFGFASTGREFCVGLWR